MNVLTVTGQLTSDPARRDTDKGVVVEFRLAVDGQRRLWLPVTVWGHLAGTCKRYLTVGRHVAVSGQLRVDEYLAGGETRRRWYLRAEHVTFLDTAGDRVPQARGGPPGDTTPDDREVAG